MTLIGLLSPMQQQTLLKNHQIISAISLRCHKNMSLCYGDTKDALNNRKNFLEDLDIDYRNLVCAKQAHGNNIRYVTTKDLGKGALSYDTAIDDTDALITDKKNIPLAIFTADCLSIFLYDPKACAIGLVHAGWRGSKESIVVKTIKLMEAKFETEPKSLYVGFGPAIRGCCYEAGQELNQFFLHDLIEKGGHYYLDLVSVNKKQILGLGVKEINIFDAKICTACKNEEFFSYRKEGNTCGRMMSVIMLK